MKKILVSIFVLASFSFAGIGVSKKEKTIVCNIKEIHMGKKGIILVTPKTEVIIKKLIGPLYNLKLKIKDKTMIAYFDKNITGEFVYLGSQKGYKKYLSKDKSSFFFQNENNQSENVFVFPIKNKDGSVVTVGILYQCK